MKTYTQQEKTAAFKKLPRPIADFCNSEVLGDLYQGITKKHKLNLRQLLAITEATNTVLLGLEQETALEPGIHRALPELPNAATKELVADINDRIFKEAKRRLQENIVEPDDWNEEALGPEPTEEEKIIRAETQKAEERNDDDPAVIALDEAEFQKTIKEQEGEAAAAEHVSKEFETAQARITEAQEDALYNLDTPLASPNPAAAPIAETAEKLEEKAAAIPMSPAVKQTASALAREKLAAPSVSTAQNIVAPVSPPVVPSAPQTPTPNVPPYKGTDPYREPTE